MTEEEALENFLTELNFVDKNNDGVITRAEWNDYYIFTCAFYEFDDQFIQHVKNTWNLWDSSANELLSSFLNITLL